MAGETYYLLGCGGHARSVADVIVGDDVTAKVVFVDPAARPDEHILGFPVVQSVPSETLGFVPAIGDNRQREEWSGGRRLVSVISASAHVGRRAQIGDGAFVANLAHIGPEAVVGRGVIVNTAAVVEHNVTVGDFVHIAPHATVCGGVHIGARSVVGAGATIRPMITVAGDVLIGAGSVVVKDIAEPGVYAGSPARRIR